MIIFEAIMLSIFTHYQIMFINLRHMISAAHFLNNTPDRTNLAVKPTEQPL